MKYINFKGDYFPIIDETPSAYVCPPAAKNEGYQFFSKENFIPEPEAPIARNLFATLWEDYPAEIVNGMFFPGWYRVLIDGYYTGTFSAPSQDIAIKQFYAGLYRNLN